jgi:hypothetical protein
MDNVQQVVAIQNLVTSDLTWWNPARKTKPQNFKAGGTSGGIHDPTGGGGAAKCDFCGWKHLTAEDTFGRIEGPYAVSASNLFKYAAPYQGVVLFKHHDPLHFNLHMLCDLLNVADGWFQKAIFAAREEKRKTNTADEEQAELEKLHPILVWNCLGRAGASQFHGHAQVMVSGAPFPAMKRESEAILQYKIQQNKQKDGDVGGGAAVADYYTDLVEAHGVVGLARRLVIPLNDKNELNHDYEIIWDDKCTSSGSSSKKATAMIAATKTATATAHVSLCPTKDAEIVIHGDSLHCPAFQLLFYAALRALIDDLEVESFNAGIHNIIPIQCDNTTATTYIPSSGAARVPIVARVVSRGRLSSGASDFGGLEVFAGASIGHTDPWTVMEALDISTGLAMSEELSVN